MIDVELDPARAQVPERVFDHREVPQPQEVHLQQAERLDPVHVELGHDLLRVVARVLRQLQRQVVHERGVADHHAGGVHRVLAAQPLERTGGLDDLLGLGLLLVGRRQVGRELQRVFDRVVPAHHRRRVHLAEAVAHHRREAQHARGVADALLALDRLERDDLGDVVRAVLLGGVADHLVATTLVEVHVDVGHLDALGIEEALEQQAVAQRIEVGDAQAVRHHRAGRAAAAGPDADAVLARVADQVPHDQEVAAEPHRRDDPELVVDAVSHLGGDLGVALRRAVVDQLTQVGVAVEAAGGLEPGQVVALVGRRAIAVDEVELDAFGDRQGVVARLGELAEDLAHLLGALEVELLGLEPEALHVGLHLLLLDAQQDVVRLRVLLQRVVQVVRADDGDVQLVAQVDLAAQDLLLLTDPVVLELDEVVVGPEDVAVLGGGLARAVVLAVQQLLRELRTQAAREADDAFGVFGHELLVHARPVVEALEVGVAHQLQQVAVPGLVLGEQGEVVVLLLALAGVAIEP